MSGVATSQPSTTGRRRRALERYLERLRLECANKVRTADRPTHIDTGEGVVAVDPWVMEQIRAFFDDGAAEHSDGGELLAHSVALQLKSTVDACRLKLLTEPSGKAFYTVQAELMLDTALGMALLREIQSTVNGAVGRGRLEWAREMTRFQHDLRASVTDIKQMIAESEQQSAELLSDNLTDQPREMDTLVVRSDQDRNVQQLAENRLAQKRAEAKAAKRVRKAMARLPSRTEVLVILLAVMAAAWLGFVKLPIQFERSLTVLNLEHLPRVGAFVNAEARPPSLYVTVDPQEWESMDAARQRAIVASVSNVLVDQGYTGAVFKTTDGVPVARWLELTGVGLIEKRERFATPEEAHNTALRGLADAAPPPESP